MKESTHLGNNYPGSGSDLNWCVQDSRTMAAFGDTFGFVTKRANEVQPTRFKEELRSLVYRGNVGLITGWIFSHSGHGTNFYSLDEPDHYREALWFTEGIVLDKEVREILDEIKEGVPNLVFFDTCFSGGMMRLAIRGRRKFVPSPILIPISAKRIRLLGAAPGNEVFISGCKEDEYSYDADDLQNGAATYALVHSCRNNNTFLSWNFATQQFVPSEQYPQTMELLCKEENKTKIYPLWFNPIISDIPDIPNSEQPPVPIKLSFWKKLWTWIKRLFGY